jgi:hypothetical protein
MGIVDADARGSVMSTFDQKLAAQTGQTAVFASNAAVALSRQVAERQKELAQELRTPVIVETPAERAERKEQPGTPEGSKSFMPTDGDGKPGGKADAGPADVHRIDVRI